SPPRPKSQSSGKPSEKLVLAQFTNSVPSIEMVIFCAVGGRLSVLGAVYGALLVNWAKTSFSEGFPELWLFGLGGLFIAVVMLFPNGLAGIWTEKVVPQLRALMASRRPETSANAEKEATS
ncbi:MAG: hypothetical protein AAFQ09_11990, partial [Pseudomonadota bacterium]